ncbi:hypothetical protein EET67_23855 [Pseudaminobacter arsenicus]|uniref:Uncharacterized protein n=1 Tax=Borborobacter arsenicus TaxID=1851146 RepID=A0A432UZG6_9HYPH|nr:hypothetical protein [Pseudaminobacter arsenicus]RUM95344.1 hypothetical protein EET67_23855 [Pseudaminobacter arsenicus]
MRVENVQTSGQNENGFLHLCTFTLELTSEVKLFGLRLIEAPDGNLVVQSALTMSGAKAYSLSPMVRQQIALLAYEAWKGAAMKKFSRLANL